MMKPLILLLAGVMSCSPALAQNITLSRQGSPHPTQLVVKYRDELLPVVGVRGTDPVVLVGGKEKRIRTDTAFLPTRARGFGSERVEVRDTALHGTQIGFVIHAEDTVNTAPRVGNHGGIAEFATTLVSRNGLKGGFIAVVLYSQNIFHSDSSLYRGQIVVRELPELPAGTPVPVKFTSKMFTYVPGQLYFVQVFDDQGREVVTNTVNQAWPYYTQVERYQLKQGIARYQEENAGKNLGAKPVVTIMPLLPEEVQPPKDPVVARLTLSAEGTVTEVNVRDNVEPEVRRAITEALRGWLFFPRLIYGQAVESQVEVPLKF